MILQNHFLKKICWIIGDDFYFVMIMFNDLFP